MAAFTRRIGDIDVDELLDRAVGAAASAGATYADARFVSIEEERLQVKNGDVEGIRRSTSSGIGIRVIVGGCWGFAATNRLDPASIEATARTAVDIASASQALRAHDVRLTPLDPQVGSYATPFTIDPFDVALEDKLDLLVRSSRAALAEPGADLATAMLRMWRRHQIQRTSEGSRIEQKILHTGGGLSVVAIGDDETQVRSYPNSFGGDYAGGGWEFIEQIDLLGNAPRVASEAVQLLRAPECPSDVRTLVLDGSQVGLQVHESVGHPIELDRVLGMEAAFAGTSFLTPADRGSLRYGSEAMNVRADATTPGAMGTFGWDDEGVPATETTIIEQGVFRGFLSSRDTAPELGADEPSGATVRAESWQHLPMIRMTNVSLLPGEASTMDELLDGIDRGVYLSTNRSWSIDDKRVNFQFGTEWGQEIVDGKLGRVVRNGTYTGRTQEFWGALESVGGPDLWHAWGLPNCGKGQPEQVGFVAHGAAPARFGGIQVGVAK